MTRMCVIVGEPGIGKSTAVARLTERFERRLAYDQPMRDRLIEPGSGGVITAVELGRRRDDFAGTDAMPMNAITKVDEWLRSGLAAEESELIIAEGARLANARLLDAAAAASIPVAVVFLCHPAVARQRREQRGSKQNPSWVAGAATRAKNFYELAATRPSEEVTRLFVMANDADRVHSALRMVTGL